MGRPRKLTPWFEGHVKPERPGVYERVLRNDRTILCYSYWDGDEWWTNSDTARIASKQSFLSVYQDLQWRGLANPSRVRK